MDSESKNFTRPGSFLVKQPTFAKKSTLKMSMYNAYGDDESDFNQMISPRGFGGMVSPTNRFFPITPRD